MNRCAPHAHSLQARSGLALLVVAFVCANSAIGADKVRPFRTGILPLLTKAGCNSGACHGAATGQGGFKLSLLAYDPEEDYERMTRERGGRRIDRSAPLESLLLRKSSGQIEHEGGRRLLRHSEGFEAVRQWIEAGAPFGPRDLRVVGITVSPDNSFLPTTNGTLNLHVVAELSDGSREDVTSLALYSSNDDAIAEVGKEGEVRAVGRGLTSIMVRYSGQVAAARVAVPFGDAEVADDESPNTHWIDRQISAELKRLRLPRSGLSSDGEFLRRVYLDLIGRLPTPEPARDFLREPASPEKRQRLIEELLRREEFVDLWTMRLADLLLIGGKPANAGATGTTGGYHNWLRSQVARNTPFNEITYALLTASGTPSGPAGFFTLASDPRDLAEHVGRIFLGTQIACARCHAHPADRWTREDYHRFAACFARVSREHEGRLIQVAARGEVDDPRTGEPLAPRPLGARVSIASDAADRRIELARWMTNRDTPQFARTIVNRIWKHLLGRGLVEPVDDLRPTNPATHPALLEALAKEFVEHGYDLRWLIRTITSTRTYQLTSRTRGLNRLDDRFYSHACVKELPAQVFVDVVSQVTGVSHAFHGT